MNCNQCDKILPMCEPQWLSCKECREKRTRSAAELKREHDWVEQYDRCYEDGD
jgi:hypothetical protein